MSHHERLNVEGSSPLQAKRVQFAKKLSEARHASEDRTSAPHGTDASAERETQPKHATMRKRIVRVANTCPVNRGQRVAVAEEAEAKQVCAEKIEIHSTPALRASAQDDEKRSVSFARSAEAETRAEAKTLPAQSEAHASATKDSVKDSAKGSAEAKSEARAFAAEDMHQLDETNATATPSATRASRPATSRNTSKRNTHIYRGTAMSEMSEFSVSNIIKNVEAKKDAQKDICASTKASRTKKNTKASAKKNGQGTALRLFTAAALAASLAFGSVASAFGTNAEADAAAAAAAAEEQTTEEVTQETPVTETQDNAATETNGGNPVDIISTTTRLTDSGTANTINGTVSMNSDSDIF